MGTANHLGPQRTKEICTWKGVLVISGGKRHHFSISLEKKCSGKTSCEQYEIYADRKAAPLLMAHVRPGTPQLIFLTKMPLQINVLFYLFIFILPFNFYNVHEIEMLAQGKIHL